jgi:hypothetical protein
MKKPAKILLLVASVWPFIYGIIFFIIMLSTISSMPLHGRPDAGAFEDMFRFIIPLHLLTMLDVLGLTIFYMVNVFRNDRVVKDKKALWAAVLFLGNVIAFPVYWYYYIWPEKNAPLDAARDRKSLYYTDPAHWVNDATRNEDRRDYAPPPDPPDWR